jgi:cell division FtsZ-interacting protein ZapD
MCKEADCTIVKIIRVSRKAAYIAPDCIMTAAADRRLLPVDDCRFDILATLCLTHHMRKAIRPVEAVRWDEVQTLASKRVNQHVQLRLVMNVSKKNDSTRLAKVALATDVVSGGPNVRGCTFKAAIATPGSKKRP